MRQPHKTSKKTISKKSKELNKCRKCLTLNINKYAKYCFRCINIYKSIYCNFCNYAHKGVCISDTKCKYKEYNKRVCNLSALWNYKYSPSYPLHLNKFCRFHQRKVEIKYENKIKDEIDNEIDNEIYNDKYDVIDNKINDDVCSIFSTSTQLIENKEIVKTKDKDFLKKDKKELILNTSTTINKDIKFNDITLIECFNINNPKISEIFKKKDISIEDKDFDILNILFKKEIKDINKKEKEILYSIEESLQDLFKCCMKNLTMLNGRFAEIKKYEEAIELEKKCIFCKKNYKFAYTKHCIECLKKIDKRNKDKEEGEISDNEN
jgi:hypothetical protein